MAGIFTVRKQILPDTNGLSGSSVTVGVLVCVGVADGRGSGGTSVAVPRGVFEGCGCKADKVAATMVSIKSWGKVAVG